MSVDIVGILSAFNPTVNEIVTLFKGLSVMSPNVSQTLIKLLDENVLAKIADWAQSFIKRINDLGPAAIDANVLFSSEYGSVDGDFFSTMKDSKYIGPKLTADILQDASNQITKAVKENDWDQAIQVGIGIAKYLTVLA